MAKAKMRLSRGTPGTQRREDVALVWIDCACGESVAAPKDVGTVTCGMCVQRMVAGVAPPPKKKEPSVPRVPAPVVSPEEAAGILKRLQAGKTTLKQERTRLQHKNNGAIRKAVLQLMGGDMVKYLALVMPQRGGDA